MTSRIRLSVKAGLIFLFLASQPAISSIPTFAQGAFVTGDFQVRWPDRWHVVDRIETRVVLYDGYSHVYIFGTQENRDPAEALPEIVENWFDDETFEDGAEAPGTFVSDDDRASVVHTYLYRVDEDNLEPYAVYFETWQLTETLLVWMVVDAPWGVFNADPDYFGSIMNTLDFSPYGTDGETNPSFVEAEWRVGIASVAFGESLDEIGLMPVSDINWLVVLADVTNWSSQSSVLPIETFSVVSNSDRSEFGASLIHSQSVARSLGLDTHPYVDGTFAQESTDRIVLVFQVPVNSDSWSLKLGSTSFPLDIFQKVHLVSAQLPAEAHAPSIEVVTIAGLNPDSTISVVHADGTRSDVRLTGVTLPNGPDCYARESISRMMRLVGTTALLERDPSVLSSDFAYVWVPASDGTRALLNYMLLSRGGAMSTAIPEAARFKDWLEMGESTAEAESAGLWRECA